MPLCSSPRLQMTEYRERYVCFSPVSIIPPFFQHSSSSTCYACQKDKRVKPDNFPKNNALSEMGKHGIEKYFHQSLESSTLLSHVLQPERISGRSSLGLSNLTLQTPN